MHGFEKSCGMGQEALWNCFWDEEKGWLSQHYPRQEKEDFISWWQAHAADVLMDAWIRTEDPVYMDRIRRLYSGVWEENGHTFLHNWVDDMEWHALALLRLWDLMGDERCIQQVKLIWEDVKSAWNDNMGGGIAWKKDQLDYKNTPANAPAAILAFRLYTRFGQESDLEWGRKILGWLTENLVDPESGFVWDGMNRLGDGKIDYDWEFTYCQGVFMQAALEYWKISGDGAYRDMAVRTFDETVRRLADKNGGIFPYEGPDDCGLFRGIFFRYSCELYKACPQLERVRDVILRNAGEIAEKGQDSNGMTGPDWSRVDPGPVDLAQHLSGLMTLEMAAAVE